MTSLFGALLLASLSVAFPKDGAKLPYIEQCYMIGATNPGTSNIVVNGECVAVHPLGGWVAMVEVKPGTNVVTVGATNVAFTVAPKPVETEEKPPKVYAPLPDFANATRTNRTGTIIVDAGHGGEDYGTVSPHNLKEKDVNLLVARAVAKELKLRGFKVLMTRESDVAIALYDRPKLALTNQVDAFVSIHHNAPPFNKDPRTLRYHAVYAWNTIGEALAKPINLRMGEMFDETLINNGVIHANFAVTRNPEVPSCLVEVDFMTTPEGEIDCFDRKRIRRVAKAIAEGVADWHGENFGR